MAPKVGAVAAAKVLTDPVKLRINEKIKAVARAFILNFIFIIFYLFCKLILTL
jgi:hypothetical protein